MRSSQRRSLLARGTKAVLLRQWPAGCAKHTFVISQEIASCEIKSLRHDAQLAEKKPARARNKSCAAKAVARGVCKAHFCFPVRLHRTLKKSKRTVCCPAKKMKDDKPAIEL